MHVEAVEKAVVGSRFRAFTSGCGWQERKGKTSRQGPRTTKPLHTTTHTINIKMCITRAAMH